MSEPQMSVEEIDAFVTEWLGKLANVQQDDGIPTRWSPEDWLASLRLYAKMNGLLPAEE
jgi:hypothetical protein